MLKASHRPERRTQSVSLTDCGAELTSEYGRLRVLAYGRGILRVTFTRESGFVRKPSAYLINRSCVRAREVREDDGFVYIATEKLSARIDKANGVLTVCDAEGRTVFAEGGLRTLEAFDARIIDRSRPALIERYETADGVKTRIREAEKIDYKRLYRARLPLRFCEGEALYGLGQPEGGSANLRGRTIYNCQTNKSIALPFMVSSAGCGLLVDCGCPFIFNDAKNASYLYFSAVEELDYYVIPGTGDEAVRGYHYLTGTPALLPAWAFGYIQSQERYETSEEMTALAREYREKGIGLDCAVLDWCSWPDGEWGQKDFDSVRFPSPAQLTQTLHGMDVHMMISVWPNMNRRTRDNAEFKEKGLLLPGGELYDAFDPDARALYWKQAKRLFDAGIDAWWCDSSEPWTSEWAREEKPEDSEIYYETLKTASDAVGADRGNAYAFFHARAIWEGLRGENTSKRVMNLTRSAWTGQQRFGTVLWSGDISAKWETLRKQVAIGLDMAASGMPFWTQDTGAFFVKQGKPWYWDGEYEQGFDDPEYRELFVRWYEYAAFLPVFRGHGTDIRRELTRLKGKEYGAVLRSNRLRYRLLPYIYSLAGLTCLNGGTLIKPLGFNYPDDETAINTDDEFLLGDDMLVCPVCEYAARTRKVYLPRGDWYELETGARVRGGGVYTAAAPLDAIPVFVRAGAVIPLSEGGVSVCEALSNKRELLVFPGADGEFSEYRDELDGYAYENGEYTLSRYVWHEHARSLTDENGSVLPCRIYGESKGDRTNAQ
ncbi:MAG: DUF4968 domain-containing protein [Clostridia bacterium]|nr:DUF4968 domain-containing protein [Clostridia bacterium]